MRTAKAISWIFRFAVFYLSSFMFSDPPLDNALLYWYLIGAGATFISMVAASWVMEKDCPAALTRHLARDPRDHYDTSNCAEVYLTSFALAVSWPVFGVVVFFIYTLVEACLLMSRLTESIWPKTETGG